MNVIVVLSEGINSSLARFILAFFCICFLPFLDPFVLCRFCRTDEDREVVKVKFHC
jgi:hypothetical protein